MTSPHTTYITKLEECLNLIHTFYTTMYNSYEISPSFTPNVIFVRNELYKICAIEQVVNDAINNLKNTQGFSHTSIPGPHPEWLVQLHSSFTPFYTGMGLNLLKNFTLELLPTGDENYNSSEREFSKESICARYYFHIRNVLATMKNAMHVSTDCILVHKYEIDSFFRDALSSTSKNARKYSGNYL